MMERVAIVAGARTPFVRAGKAFANLGPLALAKHAVRGLLERGAADAGQVEAIAFGVVVPERGKPNLAREIVLGAGLPASIEAQTVSSYCITGLRTATVIADAIARERIECGIAGGVEWLSGADPATFKEPTTGLTMGEHMEITRREWKIARERQDEVALASHRNAVAAREKLAHEIVPLEGVTHDTGPRSDTSLEQLAALKPAFAADGHAHGRELLTGHRRRVGRTADERGAGSPGGPRAARVHRRHRVRGDPSR
jgi:acetyl-CoA acetyltransferase